MKYSIDDCVVITEDNVKLIGELIALKALKVVMPHCGGMLDKLYVGLIRDMHRAEDSTIPFSDGYDVAATTICFLCEHMNKRLGDTVPNRLGYQITIRRACYNAAYCYIDKYRYYRYNTVGFCELTRKNEPLVEIEEHFAGEEDYSTFDAIVDKMQLTPVLRESLEYYMTDLNFTEIAKLLCINRTTAYKRLWQIQRIYNAKVATVTN